MNNEINQQEYFEKVVQVNRVSKKTKGGNKRSLSVLVVAGDRRGQVGVGLGKASDVQSAVRKATSYARKHLINVPLVDNRTIPHSILIKRGAAKVILKPARAGTGIIAGGAVRVVVEAVGISDIVSKILGTRNRASNVYATLEALSRLKTRSNKGITDKEGVKEAVKESRTRVVKKVRKAGPANAAA
ncbi:MAG: 30S ribosomal protein S5 [Candidatus Daviesbacteria bacterium GW2011_GWA1_41_61]|uniref:Small ribosomal subunit protein uS5 n=1 Tax=Candidatus Daviesbacteria bacterium GW2011_GWA2_40_9 TaxID=1618424 RepID=A0A0G0TZ06_9BACT|nr:MAG: 30S ribosomal protein S5 [Candidatus Daviesbacteria bacterium GW2011_GWA2_40_9]KKR93267.1 MAG: 30S ribosomal protein S5 [Candidatus Daviesbacteria bacterium GW2011_GWB1_41_15]KKS14755.1 MAG: 30S ribosomal protein S5 [Candidatus Daviesbacteria bacterium GW2011_GWA1_41_61]